VRRFLINTPFLLLISTLLGTTVLMGEVTLEAAPTTTSGASAKTASFQQPVGRTGPMSVRETARQQLLGRIVARSKSDSQAHALLARHGFVIVSTTGIDGLRLVHSTNSDVTMGTPYVAFDTVAHRYTAYAKYHWDSDAFESNVGGLDGLALRFNRNMTNNGVTGTFYGKSTGPIGATTVRNPTDNSSAGVGYRLQDFWVALVGGKVDYNVWSGSVTMDVARPACGTSVQLYGAYMHSWGSDSLTGFSISTSGFGLSWKNGDQSWKAASQSGTWTVTC
jgi:hypothetical protein